MNDLTKLDLKALLPSSIANDETVQNICDAITDKLQMISEKSELVLLLPRLDYLPELLIDELAWQYHVDFYDYSAPLDLKRALVKEAIAGHRKKGTPAAVEAVCAAVFKSAKVFENWQYGGEPYHFQVRRIAEGIPDQTVIDNLYRAIAESKNVRSWLDTLSFYREASGTVFIGGAYSSLRRVEIYPAKIKPQTLTIKSHVSAAVRIHKGVEILCQTGPI